VDADAKQRRVRQLRDAKQGEKNIMFLSNVLPMKSKNI
jgi:hypothetical protein